MALHEQCIRIVAAAVGAALASPVGAQQTTEQELPEVRVRAAPTPEAGPPPPYAGGQVGRGSRAGLLGDRDFLDTPYNVQSYTRELIQNQQARTIGDVVQNDPSVRVLKSFGTYADSFFIRGFPVENDDVAYGGVYGILPRQLIPAELIERVEVFKGPNAFLNGMAPSGSIGGGINIVPKRAGDVPLYQVTASYYSDSQLGTHLDIGRRFGTDNAIGLRFNGVYRGGKTAVDDESRELALGAIGLDYRGSRVRLSFDVGYSDNDIYAGPLFVQVAAAAPVPTVPDAGNRFVASWISYKLEDAFGAVRGEFDFTPKLTGYATFGMRRSNEVSVLGSPTVQNAAGNYTSTRTNIGNYEEREGYEAGLRWSVATGPVQHQVVLAYSGVTRESGFFFNTAGAFAANLYVPPNVAPGNFAAFSRARPKRNEADFSSVALADTLSFADDRVLLTLGARRQDVEVRAFAAGGALTTNYDEHALTPSLGLVVKPRRNLSVYGNYIEGLSQGPTAPLTAANAGTVFAPFKSKQYETGVKIDFGQVASTLSVFQIEQPAGVTDPTTNVFGVVGEQRNRGIELTVFGEPARGVRVLGGVTLLDAELTKTAGGVNDGKSAVGVPDVQLNLSGEWDLPGAPGVTLTGRAIYTGSQYLTVTNTKSIPHSTRFDLGARYATKLAGKPLVLRATVENLLDKSYWTSAAAGYLSIGAPRTFLVSATMDF